MAGEGLDPSDSGLRSLAGAWKVSTRTWSCAAPSGLGPEVIDCLRGIHRYTVAKGMADRLLQQREEARQAGSDAPESDPELSRCVGLASQTFGAGANVAHALSPCSV